MNTAVVDAPGASAPWLQIVIATAEAPGKCVPALERIWADWVPGVGLTVLSGEMPDAASDALCRRFPGLRIFHHAGESVWHLRQRIGGLLAGSRWLVLLEDHNLPQSGWLPGLLAELQATDQQAGAHTGPRVDAIFGATCNQTSTGPWDWANYLAVLAFHWAPLDAPTVFPLAFNAAVRVSCLPAAPWALGALEQTFPRLAEQGRMSGAFVVDHIQYRVFPAVLGYHFANGRATGATLRTQLLHPWRQLAGHLLHVLVVRPWRSLLRMRQHPQGHQLPRGTAWRLPLLLAAHAGGAVVGFLAGPGQSMWLLE